MIFELGQYKVDVDVEKTRQFYQKAEVVSKACSCDGCFNFEKAVSGLPQAVIRFFADLGIDLRKVCECYVNCVNEDGTLLYGGFSHVCGTIIHGRSAWKKINEGSLCWEENETFSVSPDFHISFQEEIDLPEADFPQPVIQLEFSARLPWVLDKDNTY